MVYFLGGVILGSIAAVFLVIYLNKTAKGKSKARGLKSRKGPTSGSPILSLDEEKDAWKTPLYDILNYP